jgi:glutathione S-transferase
MQLPYLIDGEVKLTQSMAIIRYIARKHKLDGGTEQEKQRVDLTERQIRDLKGGFSGMCYDPNFVRRFNDDDGGNFEN